MSVAPGIASSVDEEMLILAKFIRDFINDLGTTVQISSARDYPAQEWGPQDLPMVLAYRDSWTGPYADPFTVVIRIIFPPVGAKEIRWQPLVKALHKALITYGYTDDDSLVQVLEKSIRTTYELAMSSDRAFPTLVTRFQSGCRGMEGGYAWQP